MRWAYIREIWDFGSTMEIEESIRKVWSQGTGKRREKESHPGRDCQTESVETREGCKKTD